MLPATRPCCSLASPVKLMIWTSRPYFAKMPSRYADIERREGEGGRHRLTHVDRLGCIGWTQRCRPRQARPQPQRDPTGRFDTAWSASLRAVSRG